MQAWGDVRHAPHSIQMQCDSRISSCGSTVLQNRPLPRSAPLTVGVTAIPSNYFSVILKTRVVLQWLRRTPS
jgi:hypothetical protein